MTEVKGHAHYVYWKDEFNAIKKVRIIAIDDGFCVDLSSRYLFRFIWWQNYEIKFMASSHNTSICHVPKGDAWEIEGKNIEIIVSEKW